MNYIAGPTPYGRMHTAVGPTLHTALLEYAYAVVSVTEFKDLTDIKVPQHSDLKLLPPTAKPWETSLTKWFDKRYTSYF